MTEPICLDHTWAKASDRVATQGVAKIKCEGIPPQLNRNYRAAIIRSQIASGLSSFFVARLSLTVPDERPEDPVLVGMA